jgi:hypothetical protein
MAVLDLVELAREYAGLWVAMDPETNAVVASGTSARIVLLDAKQAGVVDPLVIQVGDDYGALASWLG